MKAPDHVRLIRFFAVLRRICAPLGLLFFFATQAAEKPTLPPVEWVLQQVATNSSKENENDRQFLAHYGFERTKVQEERNRAGTLLKRTEKKISHRPPTNIIGVIASLPLDAENRELRAVNATNYQGRAFEKRDFTLNADLLSRFHFTLVGRETVAGRPTLLLDLEPAAKPPPERNLKDRFVNKAAGRVWVDEGDWLVRRVALHLTREVNVAGGLVGSVRAFTYDFDRIRTPEGWWFTQSVNWHLEGRAVFTRRVMDYHESRTNVLKASDLSRKSPSTTSQQP